jgi:hypothetical protein
MIVKRPSATWLAPLLAAWTATSIAGCSEELGPETMPVAHVTGVILEGRRPVSGGWIEFMPHDGTIGNLRSARIHADGTFDTDGVAVGSNVIRLVNAPLASKAARDVFGAYTSPIRRTILARPTEPLVIDLALEFASRPLTPLGASP